MQRWYSEPRWVSENGLRWYFSEPDPGGLSRLECYRRLLAEPARPTRRRFAVSASLTAWAAPLRRWADLLDVVRRSSQQTATVPRGIGQENAG
jgi:hypothetical protein